MVLRFCDSARLGVNPHGDLSTRLRFSPQITGNGKTVVIDNSSAFRYHEDVPCHGESTGSTGNSEWDDSVEFLFVKRIEAPIDFRWFRNFDIPRFLG